jgi:hypothetical protein
VNLYNRGVAAGFLARRRHFLPLGIVIGRLEREGSDQLLDIFGTFEATGRELVATEDEWLEANRLGGEGQVLRSFLRRLRPTRRDGEQESEQ